MKNTESFKYRRIYTMLGLWLVFFVLTCVLLLSCAGEKMDILSTEESNHAVLAYIAADNNLSGEASSKISALRSGFTTSAGSNRLYIYADIANVGASLVEVKSTGVDTIEKFGTENSASTETFARAITVAKLKSNAKTFGIIFFSHASGWLPAGALQNPLQTTIATQSMGIDDGDGTRHEMELTDFANAIPDNVADFVILETCFGAGAEVAYALCGKTTYLLASAAELVSPGFTSIYSHSLEHLFNENLSTEAALKLFGADYMSQVRAQSGDNKSATLSLIKTNEMQTLATIVTEISQSPLRAVSDTTINVSQLQHFDRPGYYGDSPAVARFFDLDNYIKQIANDDLYKTFSEQMARVVVWKDATDNFLPQNGGYQINSYCGLTTYVMQDAYPTINASYSLTSWGKIMK